MYLILIGRYIHLQFIKQYYVMIYFNYRIVIKELEEDIPLGVVMVIQ